MVRHILKNGKTVSDIRGHVVKEQDAKTVYALLDIINENIQAIQEKKDKERTWKS